MGETLKLVTSGFPGATGRLGHGLSEGVRWVQDKKDLAPMAEIGIHV